MVVADEASDGPHLRHTGKRAKKSRKIHQYYRRMLTSITDLDQRRWAVENARGLTRQALGADGTTPRSPAGNALGTDEAVTYVRRGPVPFLRSGPRRPGRRLQPRGATSVFGEEWLSVRWRGLEVAQNYKNAKRTEGEEKYISLEKLKTEVSCIDRSRIDRR
jgi:hypothetical protein